MFDVVSGDGNGRVEGELACVTYGCWCIRWGRRERRNNDV